jgi:anti-sigma factor RsiW
MDACPINSLSAFIDGELAPTEQERVAAHVAQCGACQAEVRSLRELSRAFAAYHFEDLRPQERANLHRQLDEQVDAPIWRLGGALGLIAASVLVVAATWLAAIPSPRSPPGHTTLPHTPAEWVNIYTTHAV